MRPAGVVVLFVTVGFSSACAAALPAASRSAVASAQVTLSPQPASSPSPSPSPSPSGSPSPDSSLPPSPEPSPSPPPAPKVSCVGALIPSADAIIGGTDAWYLYDVDDPIHPKVVCRIQNTFVRMFTGTSFEYTRPRPNGTTDIVLHALGSNNESVAATVKADLTASTALWAGPVVWTSDFSRAAYMADGGSDAEGFSVTDVWLASSSARSLLFKYSVPGKDSFGRPGFAPPTLGFSADGAYVAAGWTVSLSPVHVFRVADGADVSPPMPSDLRFAFWSKTGDTLYLVGSSGVSRWTPGSRVTSMTALPWTLEPAFSPDGNQVAFTVVTTTHQVRAYVYDIAANTDRLLVDRPRSSAVFVKSGWLWEMEEVPCVASSTTACFDPTRPDGNVLAYDLATGRETRVVFAAGQSPGAYGLTPGDLWPNA